MGRVFRGDVAFGFERFEIDRLGELNDQDGIHLGQGQTAGAARSAKLRSAGTFGRKRLVLKLGFGLSGAIIGGFQRRALGSRFFREILWEFPRFFLLEFDCISSLAHTPRSERDMPVALPKGDGDPLDVPRIDA